MLSWMSGLAVAVAQPFEALPQANAPLAGSRFAALVADLPETERYAATRDAVLGGNVPRYLRELEAVVLEPPEGVRSGPHEVVVFVTRDHLAVGTDLDHLLVPLDLPCAVEVGEALGMALPTPRIVDAIALEAPVHLEPVPLPPGPQMRSIQALLAHQREVDRQRTGQPLDLLTVGAKKDLVLTNRLLVRPEREAIYGWHHQDGTPIQPLSLFHGARYADYSHGLRLVSRTVLVDGEEWAYEDALGDPVISRWLSDEGPVQERQLIEAAASMGPCGVR